MLLNKVVCVLTLASAISFAASVSHAQSVPNTGNYQALSGLFRVGVTITTGPATQFTDSYSIDKAEDATDFLDDSELRRRYGNQYNGAQAVQGVLDFRGLPMIGSYAANSTTFNLRVPAFDTANQPYLLTFTGQTREASYQAFKDYFDEVDSAEAERLVRMLLKALAANSPLDPLAGNPSSLQGQLVRNSLDLSTGDSVIESGAKGSGEDPWMVGASYSRSSAGRFESDRIDVRFQRSFRVLEGGRALLKFDMPVSYSDTNGAREGSVQVGMGLEVPVIARKWSLEPRVSYGISASDELGSLGHIVTASVGSRYVIGNVGRGRLVLGNMAGYTQTLSTAFTDYNINPGLKNWVFRNGAAYEFPLRMQTMGRGASVRASYMFTNYTGDKLFTDKFHEATLSFGVRSREDAARNTHDLLRVNFRALFAKDYDSYSVGLGFRF